MIRLGEVELRAETYLLRWTIESPPVPIIELIEAEEIELVYSRSKGMESGFSMKDGDRRVIGINSLDAPRRQRFTAAHEVGHLDLHSDRGLTVDQSVRVYKRDEVSSMATDREEIEANAFAAALLMPSRMVSEELSVTLPNFSGGRDQLIASLARTFNVSIQAMGFRLVNLGMLSP